MKKSLLIVMVCAALCLQSFAQEAAKVPSSLGAGDADVRRQSLLEAAIPELQKSPRRER